MKDKYTRPIEYPIVCETCLGPSHFIRILKFPEGGVCHVSGRPYDVFRWKAGNGARYKKTVICEDLAKLKNVCQVCMLDLEYNLPVQVRDALVTTHTETISQEDPLPKSHIGREIALNERQKNNIWPRNTMPEKCLPHNMHMILGRREPYYRRNQARICSFFVKGCCNRGLECPFRHTVPLIGQPPKQNYHNRYDGINDEVAQKFLSRIANKTSLNPPNNKSIKTIFVGNITPKITPQILKERLHIYGEIEAIRLLYKRNCAFITFYSRSAAENAALGMSSHVAINGHSLVIRWSKIASLNSVPRSSFAKLH